MDYRLDINVNVDLDNVDVSDEETLEDALNYIKEDIELALSKYYEEIGPINITVRNSTITRQVVEAELTNIVIYEEDLQHLVPNVLNVKFEHDIDIDNRYNFNSLDIEAEEAAEDVLRDIPGLEDVTVSHVDCKILGTESGEDID